MEKTLREFINYLAVERGLSNNTLKHITGSAGFVSIYSVLVL